MATRASTATGSRLARRARIAVLMLLVALAAPRASVAFQPEHGGTTAVAEHTPGGEVNLQLPDLEQGELPRLQRPPDPAVRAGGVCSACCSGSTYAGVKKLPVHRSMLEISELIYETCKTYLIQQGKLLLLLELFIGTVIVAYFAMIGFEAFKIVIILLFRLIGMAGSYGVAWFGIRINTLANSRTAFASLRGKPFPLYDIPLQAGMSVGMMLITVELLFMLGDPAVRPGRLRRPVLPRVRHRRVARRGGAAHRGRHLHEDRRHRVRPDEGRLQDQGRRRAEPGRDRRLHGRQRGRLGRTDRRRVRDLRRDGRGADLVHHAGGPRPADPGEAARLDLHDARHDGARLGLLYLGSNAVATRATATRCRCISRRR